MDKNENKKSLEELADEALDAVTGGRSVILKECVVCGHTGATEASNGMCYCKYHYPGQWPLS